MLSALWIVVSGRVNVGGGEGSVHGRETAGGGGTAGGGIGGGGGGFGLDLDSPSIVPNIMKSEAL